MDSIFRNFYRGLYLHTGGFIPIMPMEVHLLPGDFFQIRNGELFILGNVFRNSIVNPADVYFANGTALSPMNFECSDGVNRAYASRSSGQVPLGGAFEYSRQVLSFAAKGSFLFKGTGPEAVRITNWADLHQALIIKLTASLYSFRELYVVTECAVMSSWTMALAGAAQAELEVASQEENFGLVDIFGQDSAKTIQSKDIAWYHREQSRKPAFFKAKKLVVKDDKAEIAINQLIHSTRGYAEWAAGFYQYPFVFGNTAHPYLRYDKTGVIDMLQAGQLNPNTALQYFTWTEAGLDDIEKLFLSYGT